MKTIKKFIATVYNIIVSIIILGCPVCFFIVMGKIPNETLFWLLLPAFFMILLVLLYIVLVFYEISGNYSERFLNRCCWCNFILKTFINLSVPAFFYTCFIGLITVNFFHFENTNIYVYILTYIACRITLVNSTPYYIQKLKGEKINYYADTNRVIILLSYFLFLLINQIKSTAKLDFNESIMIGFLFYLAFDRLYASIISNLPTYKAVFDDMKQRHEVEVKNRNIKYQEYL